MPRPKREPRTTMELRVNVDGILKLSIFFRPKGQWQYVEYLPDGSIWTKIDLSPDQFMEEIEKIRKERESPYKETESAEGRG